MKRTDIKKLFDEAANEAAERLIGKLTPEEYQQVKLPTIIEAVDFAEQAVHMLTVALFEIMLTPEDREWMEADKSYMELEEVLAELPPPREVRLEKPQKDLLEVLMALNQLFMGYRMPSKEKVTPKQAQSAQIVNEVRSVSAAYEALCVAIIDYRTKPITEHSPLAMFVGQFVPSKQSPQEHQKMQRRLIRPSQILTTFGRA